VDLVVAALSRLPAPAGRALCLLREVLPPGGHAVLSVGGRSRRRRGFVAAGSVHAAVSRGRGRLVLLQAARYVLRGTAAGGRRRGHPRALARLGAAIRAAGLVPRRVLRRRRGGGIVIVVERP
jgi:hypothetical protein